MTVALILFTLAATGAGTDGTDAAAPTVERIRPLDDGRVILLGPLGSFGSTGEAVEAIQRVYISEFEKLLGEQLRTPADLAAIDGTVAEAVDGCGSTPPCLLEVAAAFGLDSVITGNLTGLGDDRVIDLRHLSAVNGKELGRQSVQASGNERELIIKIRGAAVQLLAPERYIGTVAFDVKQTGVRVVVDGQLVGTTPLPRGELDLRVGRHAIEASGEGLVPFSEMVDVRYGELRSVTIDLPPNTVFVGGDTPYYARWWTWAIAGAGATSLGLGGYFSYLQNDTVSEIENRVDAGSLTGEDAFLYQDQDEQRQRALIFYGIGGALTLTTATLLSLDLF